MFPSIRWRIAVPYVILIMLATAGLVIYLSDLVRDAQVGNLEAKLTAEARLIAGARKVGVVTPVIRDVTHDSIVMEYVDGEMLKHVLTPDAVERTGEMVGRMHAGGIIHGDLTTSNIIIREGVPVFIDFGLAYVSSETEARGVDVHVFFQTLESTSRDYERLSLAFRDGYSATTDDADEVFGRVEEIRMRGRYL